MPSQTTSSSSVLPAVAVTVLRINHRVASDVSQTDRGLWSYCFYKTSSNDLLSYSRKIIKPCTILLSIHQLPLCIVSCRGERHKNGLKLLTKHSLCSLSSTSFIASSSVATPPASDSAFSLKFQYLPFSIKLFSSCLRRIPRLLVPSIFSSIMCFIWQFQRKMWPIHLAFHFLFYVEFLLHTFYASSSYHMIEPTVFRPSSAPHFETFQAFLIYFSNCPSSITIKSFAPNVALLYFLPFIWIQFADERVFMIWMFLLPLCIWGLGSSGSLRSVGWYLVTNVSVKPIRPNFKVQPWPLKRP